MYKLDIFDYPMNVGGIEMTQKELLYLEDAIGHEKEIVSVVSESIKLLEDEDLIDYMQEELDTHQKMHDKLMKVLEEESNE